ncbi:MAG: glycosyltransferase family 4 protein [Acidobacteria bacterium]|nr:glycosyltransferase family 4 protein [Acidobacteriota bacterium]
MDRDVPAAVTYWTGVWDPAREAISKEVQTIRRSLSPRSTIVSFSPGQRSAVLLDAAVVRLSARRWVTLRVLAAALERLGTITHLFGPADAWHLLRAVGRRPVIFTVVAPGPPLDAELYAKVCCFVPETEQLGAALRRAGIAGDRIRVVPPGIDLTRFAPAPYPQDAPFRILFASTPSDPREIAPRGVPLLVELARQRSDIEIVLLWRQWGSGTAASRALRALKLPSNVIVMPQDVADMPAVYAGVHAVAACFTEGAGKSCPNSIVEGLACGRPAIVSPECGIAEEIRSAGAGVVAPRTVTALAEQVEELRDSYRERARAARGLAVASFDVNRLLRSYQELYLRFS